MATDTLASPAILGYNPTKVFKNFIDGEWVESSTGETFENRNPADTRDVVGIFQKSAKADVDAAVDAAKRAFAKWRLIPAPVSYTHLDVYKRQAHAFSPKSSQRGSSHLNDAALLGPLHHALQVLAQNLVAFGMGDDGGDAAVAQLHKTIRNLLRDAVIAQLDQHVVRAFNRIARGIGQHILQVVVGEMEVAAQAKRQRVAHKLLQVLDQSLKIRAIIVIAVVGMGCGDLVRDAIGRRHAAHRDRNFPRLRSVVHFRKNMRVNVDHDC